MVDSPSVIRETSLERACLAGSDLGEGVRVRSFLREDDVNAKNLWFKGSEGQ